MVSNSKKLLQCGCLQSIFAITAFALMWVASFNCDYIRFTDVSGTSEPISVEFGLWYFRYWSLVVSSSGTFVVESCQEYPDSARLDGSWKAARAFSAITCILAICFLVFSCATSFQRSRKVTHAYEAPLYLLLALCMGLTLLFLDSDACDSNILVHLQDKAVERVEFPETCSLSTGGNLAISSAVFFFLAGATGFVAHRAEEEAREAQEGGAMREGLLP